MRDKRKAYAKQAWRKSTSISEYFKLLRMYDAATTAKERGK